jgi:two-component system chemotaxis sensor kinase CheA
MDPGEILDLFVQEASEMIREFEQGLILLERSPGDSSVLNRVFRAAHTIKGNAGIVGLESLAEIAHAMETLLEAIRKKTIVPEEPAFNALLTALDLVRVMVENVRAPVSSDRLAEARRIRAQLEACLKPAVAPYVKAAGPEPAPVSAQTATISAPPGTPAPAPAGDAEVESAAPAAIDSGARSESVRVNVRILDRLMTLAGEMVLTRNQLVQSTRLGDLSHIERVAQRVDLLTAELQDAIMATRMQSIRFVFDKFNRTVRDLARDLGKKVRLVVEDEGVELDKTIIETIGDPLTHLVRNAVDHGIESPEERQTAGKPAEGTLRLRAWHGAGQVVVDVIDDGRGIDADQVKARALSLGLARPEEARTMSPKTAMELVFRPGFTTASEVSQVSGRGVGLDVVHANLAAIGGTVQLDSTPGRGSSFRIRLPLTLAILPSLLIEVEGERFAVPQAHLVELMRVRAADVRQRIERVGGVEVTRVRGELAPVVRLKDLLGIAAPTFANGGGERRADRRVNLADRRDRPADDGLRAAPEKSAKTADARPAAERRDGPDRRVSAASAVNLAIVSAGDHTYGLVVDRLLDSIEIVVKPLGRNLNHCRCYAGATVLGDGRAALILDVVGLGRRAWIAEKAEAAAATPRAAGLAAMEQHEKLAVLLLTGGGRDLFGVPLDMVVRLQKASRAELETVGGRRVLRGPKATTPIFTVDQAIPAQPLPDNDSFYVVLFRLGKRELGLLAADVADIAEMNADFDTETHRRPGIRGSTVLGDRVMLVLDLREIVLAVAPEWKEPEEARDAGGPPRRRALIVDDSPFFLNHIAGMMEEAGYQVTKAENGAAGLNLLTRDPDGFDIVLTDIEMPVLTGFEMVERMRSNPALRKIPVIAVTSVLGAEAQRRGKDVGIDEYSIKLDRDDVLERCRRLLERGRPSAAGPGDGR